MKPIKVEIKISVAGEEIILSVFEWPFPHTDRKAIGGDFVASPEVQESSYEPADKAKLSK